MSPAKRAEILEIARATGYLVADTGREERRARAKGRITAVIPEPDRWVFGSIMAGLHDVLTPAGTSLTVYQGLSGAERARLFGSPALARQADVVVLVPMPRGVPIRDVQQIGVPVVVAGSVVSGLPSVGIDDVEVGRKATNYLINANRARSRGRWPCGPPNNWVSKFGGSAWDRFGDTDLYYLHLYDRTQADLNWHNPRVREELARVVEFWRLKGGARLPIRRDQRDLQTGCAAVGPGRRR